MPNPIAPNLQRFRFSDIIGAGLRCFAFVHLKLLDYTLKFIENFRNLAAIPMSATLKCRFF